MTAPLYISDDDLADRLGVKPDTLRVAIRWFDGQAVMGGRHFPRKEPLFEHKRYWPAVVAFLHAQNRLSISDAAAASIVADGEEHWDHAHKADDGTMAGSRGTDREAAKSRRRTGAGMAPAR